MDKDEKFIEAKSAMTNAISDFYKACREIDIEDEGFVEDVVEQVFAATGQGVVVEEYI